VGGLLNGRVDKYKGMTINEESVLTDRENFRD